LGPWQCVTTICNVCTMAASKSRCCVCRTEFYSRSDACYCSGACRQKAYRARIARETSNNGDPRQPKDAVQRARELRMRARLAREEAAMALRRAATLQIRIDGDRWPSR